MWEREPPIQACFSEQYKTSFHSDSADMTLVTVDGNKKLKNAMSQVQLTMEVARVDESD